MCMAVQVSTHSILQLHLPCHSHPACNISGKGAAILQDALIQLADQSVLAAAGIPLPQSGFKKLIARFVQIRPKSGPRCTRVPERPLFGRRWADIAVRLFERKARRHTPSIAHRRFAAQPTFLDHAHPKRRGNTVGPEQARLSCRHRL